MDVCFSPFPELFSLLLFLIWAVNTEVLDLQWCSSSSIFILTRPTECSSKIVLKDFHLTQCLGVADTRTLKLIFILN